MKSVRKGNWNFKENSEKFCFIGVPCIGFLMWNKTIIGWKFDWGRITEVLNFRVRSGVWNLFNTEGFVLGTC